MPTPPMLHLPPMLSLPKLRKVPMLPWPRRRANRPSGRGRAALTCPLRRRSARATPGSTLTAFSLSSHCALAPTSSSPQDTVTGGALPSACSTPIQPSTPTQPALSTPSPHLHRYALSIYILPSLPSGEAVVAGGTAVDGMAAGSTLRPLSFGAPPLHMHMHMHTHTHMHMHTRISIHACARARARARVHC